MGRHTRLWLSWAVVTAFCCPSFAVEPAPITALDDFYVKNIFGIPSVGEDWRLKVEGAVAVPLDFDLVALRELPAVTRMATLECAIPRGPELLVGNAVWTGAPLRMVLEAAEPLASAKSVRFHSADGYRLGDFDLAPFLAGDEIFLAYEMNGQALPANQGNPLRLVIPGAGGYHWVQWLERIEIKTTGSTREIYYHPQHTRILQPSYEEVIPLGTHVIRGMAFAGNGREITKVEVSTDDGRTWREATLLSEYLPKVWKHWEISWDVTEVGRHAIHARTVDDSGEVQREDLGYGWRGFVVLVDAEPDTDGDGHGDSQDHCPDLFDPLQRDSDGDGIGDLCDADCPNLDGRSPVSLPEFAFLARQWRSAGEDPATSDWSGDGLVDYQDLRILAAYWLSACGLQQ